MNVTVLFPDDGNITGFIHIEYGRPGKSSLAASGENYPETLRNQSMASHTHIHQLLQENNCNFKMFDHIFYKLNC